MEEFTKPKLNDRGNDLTKQWYVQYLFRHPETNEMMPQRKYISLKIKTGVARRSRADEMIKQIRGFLSQGNNPYTDEDFSREVAIKALEDLLEVRKASYRLRTIHTYRNLIKIFRIFLESKGMAKIQVGDVTKRTAIQFSDYLIRQKGYKNRTHNYAIMHMKGLWNQLIKRYDLITNPWAGIEPLQAEEPTLVTLSPDELEIIKNHLPKDDFNLWLVAGLVFYCALRPAEIMRLRPRHLRTDLGALYMDGKISKNKKSQWVEIPCDKFLADLRTIQIDKLNPDDVIFNLHLLPGPKEAAPTRIAERWRKWADTKGITKNIYDLKHNAAGMMSQGGIPVRDIQIHLRHSSLEQTEKYIERFRKSVGPGFKERYPVI